MHNGHNSASPGRSIDNVKREIDELTLKQQEALKRATYLGMTADEAQQLEARRVRITALIEELFRLKTSG